MRKGAVSYLARSIEFLDNGAVGDLGSSLATTLEMELASGVECAWDSANWIAIGLEIVAGDRRRPAAAAAAVSAHAPGSQARQRRRMMQSCSMNHAVRQILSLKCKISSS